MSTALLRYAVIAAHPDDDVPDAPVPLTVVGRDAGDAEALAQSLDYGDGYTPVQLRWTCDDGEDLDGEPLWWAIVPAEVEWCADGVTVTAEIEGPDVIEEVWAGSDSLMILSVWPVTS